VQWPHSLTVITGIPRVDEYDNPTPSLDYGPTAPRRTITGLMQPVGSRAPVEHGRQAEITTWRLHTHDVLHGRERVMWRGMTLRCDGEPAEYSPRFGLHYVQATLTHVKG
jgi:hypothetical protein